VIKEATASTFVFGRGGDGQWRTALVWHPRLECWMPSGGHVEDDESAAEAAVREAARRQAWTYGCCRVRSRRCRAASRMRGSAPPGGSNGKQRERRAQVSQRYTPAGAILELGSSGRWNVYIYHPSE
jgi:hypothetical protein